MAWRLPQVFQSTPTNLLRLSSLRDVGGRAGNCAVSVTIWEAGFFCAESGSKAGGRVRGRLDLGVHAYPDRHPALDLIARRRSNLNEALHELRRPLQALALAQTGSRPPEPEGIRLSVQMATAALDRLDREINGAPRALVTAPVAVRPLVESAVSRWRRAASYAGRTLELRWRAGDAVVSADSVELAAAVDNLLVNALEHGGTRVIVEACLEAGRLRISVRDSGRILSGGSRRRAALSLRLRLDGRGRRGHGLRVVRRTIAEHGGRFSLRSSGTGTEAVIELPLGGTGVPG